MARYLLLALFLFSGGMIHAEEKKPNILFILADDLGYRDLGCYGAEDARTPNLDRLAEEGRRFHRFRANSSVCSPTRAALFSGMVSDRSGVPGVIRLDPENSWGVLSSEFDTLPELLKESGYRTALIGKWHLGHDSPDLPNDRGFDFFHGFLGGMMDDYYHHLRFGHNLMRRDKEIVTPQGHATDIFTDWACRYIKERGRGSEPFFLYLAYNAPHSPIQPREEFVEKVFERDRNIPENRARYLALVEHLDEGIGRVLDSLKESGLEKETIVVFSSDNGGVLRLGSDNGDLRGEKGTLYEGGIRVPLIVRWPDQVPKGTQSDADAYMADLFPSFLEIAGCKKIPRQRIDGCSLKDLFQGRVDELPSREFYFVRREGGATYSGLTGEALIHDGWKLVHNTPFQSLELYNLKKDPFEKENLADRRKQQMNKMRKKLQIHIQQGGRVPWQ